MIEEVYEKEEEQQQINKEAVDVNYEEVPEGEEGIDLPQEKSLEERIKEKIEQTGYAYVYEGEILDESKLSFNSKTYCIFNKKTGIPFIYDGVVVRYGGTIEAMAALNTLKIYTGNNELMLIDYEELRHKSML